MKFDFIMYKLIMFLLFFGIVFSQQDNIKRERFDPETGLELKYDPETGEIIESNKKTESGIIKNNVRVPHNIKIDNLTKDQKKAYLRNKIRILRRSNELGWQAYFGDNFFNRIKLTTEHFFEVTGNGQIVNLVKKNQKLRIKYLVYGLGIFIIGNFINDSISDKEYENSENEVSTNESSIHGLITIASYSGVGYFYYKYLNQKAYLPNYTEASQIAHEYNQVLIMKYYNGELID